MASTHRFAVPLLLLSVPACAGFGELDDPCPARLAVEVDPAGARHQYVVDVLNLPENPMTSAELAFDLDGDPQMRGDNLLGQILSIFGNIGEYDLDAEAKALIDAGEILHLIEVQAVSLEQSEGVGVRVAHGQDTDGDPSDNYIGETFALDASRGEGFLSGRIDDGFLSVEIGTVPIAFTLPGLEEPFVLELHGARIEGEITADTFAGRIGGAIAAEDVDTKLVPILHEGLSRVVARDCSGTTCEPGSFGGVVLHYLDLDMDGTITVDELRETDIIGALFAPDVDLFDEEGDFSPRCEHVKDGLSVGLGFRAVRATFP